MTNQAIKCSVALALTAVSFAVNAVTLHLAGDSTMALRNIETPLRSWGEVLRGRIKPQHQIVNYGVGGTSTVTFRKVWEERVLGSIREGDFVIIQFGHNDPWPHREPGGPDRFCTPETYMANLRQFIREVKERKATAMLLSPTPQRRFTNDGKLYVLEKYDSYFPLLPKLAAEEKIDFMDMTAIGGAVVNALGPQLSKELFAIKYNGKDVTHPIESGARIFAELFLAHVRANKMKIADLFLLSPEMPK